MGPLTLAVFVVLVLLGAGIWVWGTPVLGVPILIVALGVGAFAMFTDRDRQTIA
jgi:hypothetical protein